MFKGVILGGFKCISSPQVFGGCLGGRRLFLFGARHIFRGYLLVLGRVHFLANVTHSRVPQPFRGNATGPKALAQFKC